MHVEVENYDTLNAQDKIKKISDTEYSFKDTLDKFSLRCTNQDGIDFSDKICIWVYDELDKWGREEGNKEVTVECLGSLRIEIFVANIKQNLHFKFEDTTTSLTLKIKDEADLLHAGIIKKGAKAGVYAVSPDKGKDIFIECVDQNGKDRMQWIINKEKVDKTSGKLNIQDYSINATIIIKAESPNKIFSNELKFIVNHSDKISLDNFKIYSLSLKGEDHNAIVENYIKRDGNIIYISDFVIGNISDCSIDTTDKENNKKFSLVDDNNEEKFNFKFCDQNFSKTNEVKIRGSRKDEFSDKVVYSNDFFILKCISKFRLVLYEKIGGVWRKVADPMNLSAKAGEKSSKSF